MIAQHERELGQPASRYGFRFATTPARDFRLFQATAGWQLWHEPTRKVSLVHEADTSGEKRVTHRVVKNLYVHRRELRQWIAQ